MRADLRFVLTCLLAAIVSLSLVACSDGDGGKKSDSAAQDDAGKDTATKGKDGDPAKPAPTLEDAAIGEVPNLHRFGDIYLAAQPGASDFAALADAGVKHVINLRGPDENQEFDEGEAVAAQGMTYANPGFSSADELVDPIFDHVLGQLKTESYHPVLLHCASGNRVGALWLAHRVVNDGLSYDAALAEAREVGLGSDALEAKARAYIEQRTNAQP